MYVPKYFKPYEFVSEKLFKIYGDDSLLFVSDELKITMDAIREFFDVPIYINNCRIAINSEKFGGSFQNRGYRDPFTSVGAKLSQHKFGRAIDFHSPVIASSTIRKQILENQNLFPHIHRMEKNVSWVHIDSHLDYKHKRIYLFNS